MEDSLQTGRMPTSQYGSSDLATIPIDAERLRSILAHEITKRNETADLNEPERHRYPVVWSTPEGALGVRSESFLVLPSGIKSESVPHWLVQLEDLNVGGPPIGIEVVSDI